MTSGEESADQALAVALIEGRAEAFEPFVERFGPLVMNFGRRMCGQRDDAEEVVQETLLKAYTSLGQLKDPSALKAWVYRVAARTCLRMRRGNGGRSNRDIRLEDLLPDRGDGSAPVEIADWSDLPLDRLLQGELRERLQQAILDLPKPYRIVLVLRDQEGLSTRETASILGISEALSKVRLHRARLAIRKALADYLDQRGK